MRRRGSWPYRPSFDYGARWQPLPDPYAEYRPHIVVGPQTAQAPFLAGFGSSLFTPRISSGTPQVLQVPFLGGSQSLFAPAVALRTIFPPLFVGSQTLFAPAVVAAGAASVFAPFLGDGDTLYAPGATLPGEVGPPLLSDDDGLFIPAVTQRGSWLLAAGTWNDAGAWDDSATWID